MQATPNVNPEDHPTYRISVSPPSGTLRQLGQYLAQGMSPYGFQLSEHLGGWGGKIEEAYTVTFQGPTYMFNRLMSLLAAWDSSWELAHVEKDWPEITYFELEAVRLSAFAAAGKDQP